VLNGQIVGDALVGIPNVNITNISTKKYVVSDGDGNFIIYAREKDTLILSNMEFDSQRIILTKADFKLHKMRIKLQVFINPLDEVLISSLTGNLETDDKNIKLVEIAPIDVRLAIATDFEDDTETSPENKLMPGYVDRDYMPDVMAMIVKLAKVMSTPPPPKKEITYVSQKVFAEAVRERFSDDFFTQTLQIKPDRIGLFLQYCENEPNVRELLDPKKEFILIDLLIKKSREYKLVDKD